MELKKSSALSSVFFFLAFVLSMVRPCPAIELEPYFQGPLSRDVFSVSFFREEKPDYYWVNAGVPDAFFNGVNQLSAPPLSVLSYSLRSIEYGVKTSYWVADDLQARVAIPFEANALLDATGNTHNVARFGDVEVAATYLLIGKRQGGDFLGLDGWYRFATGTNPFQLAYPILSTGKGAPEEAIGLEMGEDAGRFSFFQSIHYQKTQPVTLADSSLFGPGTFQWPETFEATARVEFFVFRRLQRSIDLYYEMRMRMTGFMELNGQVIPYGQGLTTDRLLFSTFGILCRVDKEFSAEGKAAYFPYDIDGYRPNTGWLFSLGLEFRPL